MEYTSRDIAKMIDLSLLRPNLSDEDVIKGCETAKKYDVATVCCGPSQVPLVKKCLAGSKVIVSTVIGFPHGYSTTESKVFEAEQALKEGAIELDMVLNIGKVLSGDFDYVEREIATVAKVTHKGGGILKVILENFYLTDDMKVQSCIVAERAGADFVKTSTGFAAGGATFTDLRLMRKTVSPKVQVKAAGGIRELDTALLVREVGGTRFGCTATEKIMEDCYRRVGK
ncbi:MAG TPA: deoxyribose-phosphate aldolase [Syntrophorhabdales bacterium]|nr:deoxyribose-phosphate aldolase [Syntrophorhabdales bacterium]